MTRLSAHSICKLIVAWVAIVIRWNEVEARKMSSLESRRKGEIVAGQDAIPAGDQLGMREWKEKTSKHH